MDLAGLEPATTRLLILTHPRRSASRLHRDYISSQLRGWYIVTKCTWG